MKYRKLGNTEISVSPLCLGTMTFGEQNTEQEGHEQLDYAFERGINFIDTAEMYPVPHRADTYTLTEQIIGSWPKLKTHRDEIILATKVLGPMEHAPHIRDGKPRLDKKNIMAAVDESLKRLKTDYIDLYQLHWPDRETNFFGKLGYEHNPQEEMTPIEETLEALKEIKRQGKVKEFGVSNETPWGVMKYLELARTKGLPLIQSVQNPYNLLNRTFEIGLSEIAHREGIGLLAYSPLAFGVLSGKYLRGKHPKDARLTLYPSFKRYSNALATQAVEAYADIAKNYDITPTTLALAFVTSRPFVTSNIIGATSMKQLKENIDSINISLDEEILNEIEKVHTQIPNPSP